MSQDTLYTIQLQQAIENINTNSSGQLSAYLDSWHRERRTENFDTIQNLNEYLQPFSSQNCFVDMLNIHTVNIIGLSQPVVLQNPTRYPLTMKEYYNTQRFKKYINRTFFYIKLKQL